MNFVRPGELDLEPYREEHTQYYAQRREAAPPLTHLSPVVVSHFDRWARPLWDRYPRHSAAAMVQYLLTTVGVPDPRRVLVIGYSRFRLTTHMRPLSPASTI
ncbi:hypothetical protein STCU_11912 [Strigomonas culicis]|uniref:Uncharacterized protein n=1 Tax=Strigomonas culicis TaxID=28005 RepID=S9ULN6_9TRYP|nr:hypothetical protein STCU_11912 [Strigomonas culicis]|eukprot:EPY15581.1 hypothetical protein STCU_11912 [Strigomonas culicis]